ncbi:MAG: Carbamoyl-phosphate synthase large chain [Verrucomicrobia bacterium ADurb.Bin006]|nr:MAG: Carbamoyl-phosphate synthase large chain [Verrucomicrobia bacterium ADurb.Bin006]
MLEVNPRASRTVPFVSKASGVPLAKLAARVMAGRTLAELGFTAETWPDHWVVKESVFPFNRIRIRTTAVYTGIPIMTTLSGARAAILRIAALKRRGCGGKALQEYS